MKKLGLALGIGLVFLLSVAANSVKPTESNTSINNAKSANDTPTTVEVPRVQIVPAEPKQEKTWKCHDTTSYNRNDNDDNYCESSDGGGKYVPDWQACQLDPDYRPSQRGASYYNNDCNR